MQRLATALSFAIILALSSTLGAQWPAYPTPDVPRKDGKPILDAPAPRTPDGKVDFSGMVDPAFLDAEVERIGPLRSHPT